MLAANHRKKKINENEYNLVDGQQRLTTIYLILCYLKENYPIYNELESFEITYERRKDCLEDRNADKNSAKNADEYYIRNAYETIQGFLWQEQGREEDIFTALTSVDELMTNKGVVKIIWHEIEKGENEREIFSRINSGKIPLTSAELIKAMFLNTLEKQTSKITPMELAKEWDEIGYYLQNENVWGFLTKDKETYTRIELLFDIYLDLNENRDEYTAYYKLQEMAQNKSVDEIYTEIKKDIFDTTLLV